MTAPVIPGPDEPGDATGGDSGQGSDPDDVQEPVNPDETTDDSGEADAAPVVSELYYDYMNGLMMLKPDAETPDSVWWPAEQKMTICLSGTNCENITEVVIDIATDEDGEAVQYKFTEEVEAGYGDISFISEQAIPMSMIYIKSITINGTPFRTIN
ncbi:MAG: hypothetical protein ACI4LP_04480 [Anaerovoracaceae bacterium]